MPLPWRLPRHMSQVRSRSALFGAAAPRPHSAGKAVALAGISAGMIAFSGCGGTSSNQSNVTLQGEPEATVEQIEMADTIDEGELLVIEDTAVNQKGRNRRVCISGRRRSFRRVISFS